MGCETILFGYIETDHEYDDANRQILQRFSYDERFPFPNIFHFSDSSSRGSTISFAMKRNYFYEGWAEWRPRFENLLGTLWANVAEVRLDSESSGQGDMLPNHISVFYVRMAPWQEQSNSRLPVNWSRTTKIEGEGGSSALQEDTIFL